MSDGPTGNFEGDWVRNGAKNNTDDLKMTFGISKRACDFMEDQVSNNNPFFMQVSYYAVHVQNYGLESTKEKYRNKKPGKKSVPRDFELPPPPLNQGMVSYAAMLEDLDTGFGMILDKIDELGIKENTYVIFTSDNGGQLKDHFTAGIGLNLSDDSKGVGKKSKSAKIEAKKMGHRTNLNLKGGKGSPFEGGFRVPMILKWPNKINKKVSSNRLVCSADFFKTFASLFGQQANFEDGEDSFSFSDIFTDKKVNNIRVDVALYSKKAISYVNKN